MKMVKQEFMPIPAQGKLCLKSGSWHVMMIGPSQMPNVGEKIMLTLKFDNGISQNIDALVRQGKITRSHHNHHH